MFISTGTAKFCLGLQLFIKEESWTAIFKILVRSLSNENFNGKLKQGIRYACRADKQLYRHDRRADKQCYWHDRCAFFVCKI